MEGCRASCELLHSYGSFGMRPNCTALYLDRPNLTHWEDELLLQASQTFFKEQEEEEDALLLAASQDYEKQCGPEVRSIRHLSTRPHQRKCPHTVV